MAKTLVLYSPIAKFLRGLLCDLFCSLFRPEKVRVVEKGVELGASFARQQVVECEGDDAFGGVGEIGVNDDALNVAHDEQGRIQEGFAILQELLVGVVQVCALAFVFPREKIFFPHICKAVAAVAFGGESLERKQCARAVYFGGGGMFDEMAQVNKVFLVRGAFFEVRAFPFFNQLLWSHGQEIFDLCFGFFDLAKRDLAKRTRVLS